MKNVRSAARLLPSATNGIAVESMANDTWNKCAVTAGAFECSETQMAQGREPQAT